MKTESLNVLVTSARMPFALDQIRKFGEQGHSVYATNTFDTAPGGHSTLVTGYLLTASPRLAAQFFNVSWNEQPIP